MAQSNGEVDETVTKREIRLGHECEMKEHGFVGRSLGNFKERSVIHFQKEIFGKYSSENWEEQGKPLSLLVTKL